MIDFTNPVVNKLMENYITVLREPNPSFYYGLDGGDLQAMKEVLQDYLRTSYKYLRENSKGIIEKSPAEKTAGIF